MKQFIPFITAIILFLNFGNALQAQSGKVELLPYRAVYANEFPFDTICPNGVYLKNFVNRDTSDHNLYFVFGNKTKRKIHCIEEGLDGPLCARPGFAYATVKTIALISDCANSKGILLLTFSPDGVRSRNFIPLYINQIDSLFFGINIEAGKTKFFLSDLDYNKKQDVYVAPLLQDVINNEQKAFACGNPSDCFDDIHYDKGNLYITFSSVSIKDPAPVPISKTIKVKWK